MPRKRITFILIPPSDGQVQEVKFPAYFLWLGGLLAMGLISAFGYYAIQYHTRVDQSRQITSLQSENDQLVRSLESARRDLEQLDQQMLVLAEQDQRLRDYHEMDPVRDQGLLLGVGGGDEPGDLPEDYTQMPAHKRDLLEDLSIRVDRLKREALYQRASFQALLDTFTRNKANLRYVPAVWPVDQSKTWPSSDFGRRTDPFTGRIAMHSGIDLAGRMGLRVWATADGEVAYAYQDKRLGNVVVINHNPEVVDEDGNVTTRPGILRTEYGHLKKILVKKGQRVRRGEVIGLMGSTGRSTGPHLHYAVRYQDRRRGGVRGYIDPKDYLLDWSDDERAAGWLASRGDEGSVPTSPSR